MVSKLMTTRFLKLTPLAAVVVLIVAGYWGAFVLLSTNSIPTWVAPLIYVASIIIVAPFFGKLYVHLTKSDLGVDVTEGSPGYLVRNENGMIYFEGDDGDVVVIGGNFDQYFDNEVQTMLRAGLRVPCGYELDEATHEHLIHVPL